MSSTSVARVSDFKVFADDLPDSESKCKLLGEVPLGSNFFVVNAGRENGKSIFEVREITKSFHTSNMPLSAHFQVHKLTDDCQLMLSHEQVQAWMKLKQ